MSTHTRESDETSTALNVGFVGPLGVRTYSFLRYLDELSSALADVRGIEVSHVARPEEHARERRPSQFLLRRVAGRLRQRLKRRLPRRVAPAIQEFEADVYHLIAPGDSWVIPELQHDRVVVTVHDILAGAEWAEEAEAPPPSNELARRSERFFSSLTNAAHVVCVSELARQEVLDHVDLAPSKVSVILNGLHPRFRTLAATEVDRARSSLPPAASRILQLCSINQARKNTGAVLRVLRQLRGQGHDVRLLRIGAHFSDADTRLIAELGIEDAIDELGRVDDDTLVEMYNVADVMLFPSLHEGFGWPPLEAMACGTPVVASNIAACREVIGDAGLLTDPRDVEGLAAHVAALLTNESLAADYRERGHERVALFTWERAASQFAELYRAIAAR